MKALVFVVWKPPFPRIHRFSTMAPNGLLSAYHTLPMCPEVQLEVECGLEAWGSDDLINTNHLFAITWGFPKIGGTPHFNRGWNHYKLNHPFLGVFPLFLETPTCFSRNLLTSDLCHSECCDSQAKTTNMNTPNSAKPIAWVVSS